MAQRQKPSQILTGQKLSHLFLLLQACYKRNTLFLCQNVEWIMVFFALFKIEVKYFVKIISVPLFVVPTSGEICICILINLSL